MLVEVSLMVGERTKLLAGEQFHQLQFFPAIEAFHGPFLP